MQLHRMACSLGSRVIDLGFMPSRNSTTAPRQAPQSFIYRLKHSFSILPNYLSRFVYINLRSLERKGKESLPPFSRTEYTAYCGYYISLELKELSGYFRVWTETEYRISTHLAERNRNSSLGTCTEYRIYSEHLASVVSEVHLVHPCSHLDSLVHLEPIESYIWYRSLGPLQNRPYRIISSGRA